MTFGRQELRVDIQGLRAIAVLAVVIYHAGFSGFSGGFVGVDIFFVISGFLITRKLLYEVELTGSVRPVPFFMGRLRRLLPNAVLTLIAIAVATALLFPSYRHSNVIDDIVKALVFWANFHFAERSIDYFHMDDPPSPVLHFWSLSVEEQFYIALPMLLFFLCFTWHGNRRLAINWLLASITVASLVASLVIIKESQPQAFFHSETRVWQLAIGGLLGVNFDLMVKVTGRLRSLLASIGFIAVAIAVFQFSDDVQYPGWRALIPTAGTAAVILGAERNRILFGLLSLRPLQWIGDRSYSLYLWHWPAIVFATFAYPTSPLSSTIGALISVPICHLAYRFVERPIHHGKFFKFSTFRTLGIAAFALTAVVTFCGVVVNLPTRPVSAIMTHKIIAAGNDDGRNYSDGCHVKYDTDLASPCVYGQGGRTVMLFGDSHAAQWLEPLLTAAGKTGWAVAAATKTSCPPANVTVWDNQRKAPYDSCDRWRDHISAWVSSHRPQLIILTGSTGYKFVDRFSRSIISGSAAAALWRSGLNETIQRFEQAGSKIVVLRDTPRVYDSFRDCLSATDPSLCGRSRGEAMAGRELYDAAGGATVADFTDLICDTTICPVFKDGQVIFRDSHHLTSSFAAKFWQEFSKMLESFQVEGAR